MVQTEAKMQSQLLKNEPLARYTSWRVGGNADSVFIAESLSELQAFLQSLDDAELIVFMDLAAIYWYAMVACAARLLSCIKP